MVALAVRHAVTAINARLRLRYRALRATRRSRIRRWEFRHELGYSRTVRRVAQYYAHWRHV